MSSPELARLTLSANCHSSWCARVGDWLQIDLGRDWDIGIILTQGALDGFGFVKLYTLSYKTSDGSWQEYKEPGESDVKVLISARGMVYFL